ncbi:hypothetical protein ACW2QC_11430 [Virgibacillus sp. FSP13]
MKSKQTMELSLNIYLCIYVLLYIVFLFIISLLHSSFSIISIPAITGPFIILLIWTLLLLRRNNNSHRKVKHKRILIMSIIPPLICLVLLGINEYNSNFNTEKWVNKFNERVYMTDNLLNNFKLQGLTKAEVYKLLGSPDNKSKSKLIYYLGRERGLIRIDSEQLMIKLNEKGIVTNYRVTTD